MKRKKQTSKKSIVGIAPRLYKDDEEAVKLNVIEALKGKFKEKFGDKYVFKNIVIEYSNRRDENELIYATTKDLEL